MRRAGFGIHAGPDWKALRTVYAEVFGGEPDLRTCGRYRNGPSGYRVEVALISCVDTEDIYVPALAAVSHAGGPESPEWLTRGTSEYASTMYLVASGELDREWRGRIVPRRRGSPPYPLPTPKHGCSSDTSRPSC